MTRASAPQHNHKLDGALHEECPACEFIRAKQKRRRAHEEVKRDLEEIYAKALLRYKQERKT